MELTLTDAAGLLGKTPRQVRYLLEVVDDDRGRNALVRAHAPTAIARLLQADMPDELREAYKALAVEDFLERLDDGRERKEVQQSCVLALGALGDADPKGIDEEIRDRLCDEMMALGIRLRRSKRWGAIEVEKVGGEEIGVKVELDGRAAESSEEGVTRFRVVEGTYPMTVTAPSSAAFHVADVYVEQGKVTEVMVTMRPVGAPWVDVESPPPPAPDPATRGSGDSTP